MEASHDKLFIFTFAALLLILTSSAQRQQQCSDCGNTSVPYPLSTAPTCGDQAYKIRCDAGRLLFDTVDNTYPITSVNPTNQRLVIKPATLSSNDTCVTSDIVHEGIQLNSSLPFNITSSNTILYLNCTETLLQSPLNCTSASLCHVYTNQTDSVAPCREAVLCCTFRTGGSSTEHRIRVREAGCSAYTSFVNLDPNLPVDRWPEPGLEIQWMSHWAWRVVQNKVSMLAYELVQMIMIQEDYIINKIIFINHFCLLYKFI